MKLLLNTIFILFLFFTSSAQNVPIDFEENGHGADWTWTTFENDTNPELEIVENPDISGINTSLSVAKFTALQAGQAFAGCESLHGAGIGSFTIDESNAIIRIMVWKNVISDIGIKLVREDNWSLGEIKIPNTLINQWEQIEFDFSGHIGNTYDQIVIFPDFNERQSDNIIYFDEIYGEVAMSTNISEIEQSKIKITPNPAISSITVRSEKRFEHFEIYATNGELMKYNSYLGSPTIDISDLPKGMYIVKASNQKEYIIEKFIKN